MLQKEEVRPHIRDACRRLEWKPMLDIVGSLVIGFVLNYCLIILRRERLLYVTPEVLGFGSNFVIMNSCVQVLYKD